MPEQKTKRSESFKVNNISTEQKLVGVFVKINYHRENS